MLSNDVLSGKKQNSIWTRRMLRKCFIWVPRISTQSFFSLFLSSSIVLPQNLNQNKRTLLPKFYGLYCVQSGGKNIRIAVMNNLLPNTVRMHLKYDLKGSTYKRRASAKEREKASPTYKDLDFMQDMPGGLILEGDKYNAVCKTIQRDCLVSTSEKMSLNMWNSEHDIILVIFL